MWISNTAATLIMLPNAGAVIDRLEEIGDKDSVRPFAVGLYLGIAFSCNIGGVSTTIGTPPNLIFLDMYQKFFPSNPLPTFFQWMTYGVPLGLIFMIILYLIIIIFYVLPTKRNLNKKLKILNSDENGTKYELIDIKKFKELYKELGSFSFEEGVISFFFILIAILWATRSPIGLYPGWGALFKKDYVTDGTVAIFVSLFLFMIPAKNSSPELRKKNLDYDSNLLGDDDTNISVVKDNTEYILDWG
jgi:solute carrier family 13 (sodium-dependent dicarboxylate transporter), member 2/3/5